MGISLFRSIAGQYEHLRRVNTVPMMNVISHHIENQVINHQLPVDFYAGFQKFSQFPDQMRRYQKLGAAARRVYVIGVPDVRPTPIPGVEYIPLDPSSPLAKEWFVLVDTPEFWSLLSTLELPGRDEITGRRRFDGVWTFDHHVVDRATLLVTQMMDRMYTPIANRNHESQNRHIAEISSSMIQYLEREKMASHRRYVHSQTLRTTIEKSATGDAGGRFAADLTTVLVNNFGATGAVMATLQGDSMTTQGAAGEVSAAANMPYMAGNPSRQAIASQKPVIIADMRGSFDREAMLPTAQTLAVIPIVGRMKVHGIIAVSGSAPNLWSEDDLAVLEAIGGLVGTLMEARAGGSGSAAINTDQWQAPVVYLMALQRKLRMSGVNPQQDEILNQIDRLTVGLAQSIGVQEATLQRILNASS